MGRRMGERLYFGPAYWYLGKPIPWFKWKMEKGKERRSSYCIKMKLHNGTNKANNPLTNPSSQQTPHKGLVHLKSTATLPHRLLAVCQLLLLLERLLQHLLLLSSRLHLTNPRLAHALHLLHLLLTQLLLLLRLPLIPLLSEILHRRHFAFLFFFLLFLLLHDRHSRLLRNINPLHLPRSPMSYSHSIPT